MEEHYIVSLTGEATQQLSIKQRLSVWLDTDEFIGWDHWFIDPRGMGECRDYIHLVFNEECECWRVWTAHHDDRKA